MLEEGAFEANRHRGWEHVGPVGAGIAGTLRQEVGVGQEEVEPLASRPAGTCPSFCFLERTHPRGLRRSPGNRCSDILLMNFVVVVVAAVVAVVQM